MIIINKRIPTNKRIGSGSLKEGMTEAKERGMSIREVENALREHTDGANATERRQVYTEFFKKPK